jgi:hypothetical protein
MPSGFPAESNSSAIATLNQQGRSVVHDSVRRRQPLAAPPSRLGGGDRGRGDARNARLGYGSLFRPDRIYAI